MHLIIATPCYGGLVTQRYMQSVFRLMEYGRINGIAMSLELLGYDSLIPRARNALVATFLDRERATHLLFIDADIGFEPEAVARMLAFDVDLVAGMYPLKIVHYGDAVVGPLDAGEGLETAQLRYVGTLLEGPGAERRDGFGAAIYAGTGFMMIRRSALEQMIKAYPQTAFSAAHTAARPQRSVNQYALFDGSIDPTTREYLSEDYTFCARWRAIGGKLWLDLRSRLIHVGPRDFCGDAALRYDRPT